MNLKKLVSSFETQTPSTPIQSEPLPDSEQLVEQVTEMMKMVTNFIKGEKPKDELQ